MAHPVLTAPTTSSTSALWGPGGRHRRCGAAVAPVELGDAASRRSGVLPRTQSRRVGSGRPVDGPTAPGTIGGPGISVDVDLHSTPVPDHRHRSAWTDIDDVRPSTDSPRFPVDDARRRRDPGETRAGLVHPGFTDRYGSARPRPRGLAGGLVLDASRSPGASALQHRRRPPGQARTAHRVDLSDYADRVIQVLDGIDEPVTLVGHSLGGATISTVAERRPERIAGSSTLRTPATVGATPADPPPPRSRLQRWSQRSRWLPTARPRSDSCSTATADPRDVRTAIERLVPEPIGPAMSTIGHQRRALGFRCRAGVRAMRSGPISSPPNRIG